MILCCGEALIDMLPRTLPDTAKAMLPVPGGAVFNTAIALGRLGIKTGFFSGLSNDMFGRQLTRSLRQSNVDVTFCAISNRPTTLAFVELIDGQAKYVFYDEGTAGRMLEMDNLPELISDHQPNAITALHFGAISLIPEPCGSTYEALMMREADERIICLDPNIRPSFITNPNSHRARIKRMLKMADIIKVSDEDIAWIEPDKNPRKIIDGWIKGGASLVVLTLGSKGATAFGKNASHSIQANSVEVVDTIGAGDGFDAGLLAGLQNQRILSKPGLKTLEEDHLKTALELATRVAAITVSRAGANPPFLSEINDK